MWQTKLTPPTPLLIPELRLSLRTPLAGEDYNLPDLNRNQLQASWKTSNLEFLIHNPEVWLFHYKSRKKKFTNLDGDGLNALQKAGWVHPPHQDGMGPGGGSAWYSGTPLIRDWNTETSLPILRDTQWYPLEFMSGSFPVEVDPEQWWYTDAEDNYRPYGGRKGRNNCRFRFAIVVDNPYYDPDDLLSNPKLIGPMSEVMRLSYVDSYPNQKGFWWSFDHFRFRKSLLTP